LHSVLKGVFLELRNPLAVPFRQILSVAALEAENSVSVFTKSTF